LVLAAVVPVGIAAGWFWWAHPAVRDVLTPPFRGKFSERLAPDVYFWDNQVSDTARPRNVQRMVGLAVAPAPFALAHTVNGNVDSAVVLGAVSALIAVQAWVRWLKYRRMSAR